jgi:hypothetical protein
MTWARPTAEARAAQRLAMREANTRALVASHRPEAVGSYDGGTRAARPKITAYRDAALLDMARGRRCLLLVPACCNHRPGTTVACHSNLSMHGKGKSRKADDCYSVWGCAACHAWLDTSGAPAAQKRITFMRAHAEQVLAWREIATSPAEPERFRSAARRALEQLGAGPLITLEAA